MVFLAAAFLLCSCIPARATQMQVYGAWHCGNDYCTWASVRDMTDFDTKNHWIIDPVTESVREPGAVKFCESLEAFESDQ